MAGIYDRTTMDSCHEKFEDELDQKIYNYTLDRNAVMRQNLVQAPFMSQGRQPDFYGPLAGDRVTKESFLQGRGHRINKCPDCEVRYLPKSLFNEPTIKSSCDRVDLQGLYTRVPKSCNGLSETIVTPHFQMPENYKKGYSGYNAVVYTHMQTKNPEVQHRDKPGCYNYGSYAPTRDFSRYTV